MSYHTNHADTIPHIAPGEHEAGRQASIRAWECLMLATTPQGWAALLRGQTLPLDQIDQLNLQRARRRSRRQ